jgi:hypothetical protein
MAAPTNMTIPTLQSLGDLTKEDDHHPSRRAVSRRSCGDFMGSGWGNVFIVSFILLQCCLLSNIYVGALLLHYACYYDPSPDVVKVVFEGYPKAVEKKDSDGDLPLHIALKKNSHHDTAYPKAAEAPDNDGALPLHYACNYNVSSDIIKKLFEPYQKDHACAYANSSEVLKCLVTLFF